MIQDTMMERQSRWKMEIKKDFWTVIGVISAGYLISSGATHFVPHFTGNSIFYPNRIFYQLLTVLILALVGKIIPKGERLKLSFLIILIGGFPLALMQLFGWKLDLNFISWLFLSVILLSIVIAYFINLYRWEKED